MPWMATSAPGGVSVTQRVERRDSRTQQRCRSTGSAPREPAPAAGPDIHHLGVAAVLGGSRLRLVEAVDEIAAPALHALAAVAAEEADTDAVADVPGRHARPDRVDDADDLVAGDDRLAGVGRHPSTARISLWQTPQLSTRTRTCPARVRRSRARPARIDVVR